MPKIIFCILFNLFACTTFAQIEAFKVIALKGFPSLSSGRIITVGGVLFENEILQVEKPCYIALIHKSGKTLEIKEAGKYNLAEISKKFYSNVSNINLKMANYLSDSIYKFELESLKRYGSSIFCMPGYYNSIFLCLSKSSFISDGINTIHWHKKPKIEFYKIEITDMSDSILLMKETKDTFFVFNTNSFRKNDYKSKDKYKHTYILSVKNSKNDSLYVIRYGIRFPFENKDLEIQNSIIELNKEYSDASALDCLIKASYYSKKKYFLNALYYYELAQKLKPDILEYRNAYVNFMKRNELSDFITE